MACRLEPIWHKRQDIRGEPVQANGNLWPLCSYHNAGLHSFPRKRSWTCKQHIIHPTRSHVYNRLKAVVSNSYMNIGHQMRVCGPITSKCPSPPNVWTSVSIFKLQIWKQSESCHSKLKPKTIKMLSAFLNANKWLPSSVLTVQHVRCALP